MNKNIVISAVALLMTGGCGYHMRGAYDLPVTMKKIYIQGGSAFLREQFNSVLKSSSGQLVESPENADIVLTVYKDDIDRRVLSLSERGRSNDIELAGHIEYDLRDAKNNLLLAKEPIDFRKEYFNDQQDVIAKDNEETIIRKEMYQQVVRTIINRGRAVFQASGR